VKKVSNVFNGLAFLFVNVFKGLAAG